ncbi:MAG: hypothetical protein ACTSQY_05860 [Candidatus Odinarchaeia archaeon]
MPSWKVIAKNEFKILTSRFNNHRTALIIGLFSFSCAYLLIIPIFIPWLLNAFLIGTPLLDFLIEYLPTLLILVFMGIFIYSLLLPLSNTIQDIQKGQLEIIISSPIKPQHILFGIFIGRMFLYMLFIIIVGVPLFSLLAALTTPPFIFILLSIAVLVLLFFVGGWIGTLISASLQSKLSKLSRGRDIGRAITFVFSFVIFILFYSIFFFIESLQGSLVFNSVIQILPSTWVSNIVTGLLLGAPTLLSPLLSGVILLVFSFSVLFLGYKLAGRIYTLEPPQATVQRVEGENIFFRVVRKLIPGSLSTVTVTQIKDFTRRLENVAKIGYASAITLVIAIVQAFSSATILEFFIFFTPIIFAQIIISMLGSDFTVKGRDKLWIYKKSPNGVLRLIQGKILQLIIITVPVSVLILSLSSMIAVLSLPNLLITVGLGIFFVIVFSILVVGIFSINPVFNERSAKFGVNMIIFITVIWALFFAVSFLYSLLLIPFSLESILTLLIFYAIISILFVFYGSRKLSSLE